MNKPLSKNLQKTDRIKLLSLIYVSAAEVGKNFWRYDL